jgi:hypothetical protein
MCVCVCVCVCGSVVSAVSGAACSRLVCWPLLHCSHRVERCAEVPRTGDCTPLRAGDIYSACACVVMDPHHMNHHTPTEAASGGGTSSNGSQTSQGSNSTTPVVIPGPSSSSSSSAPPPPVVVGATQAPLTSPVPSTKIVSRNVNGTCELLSHHAVFWIELSVRVTGNWQLLVYAVTGVEWRHHRVSSAHTGRLFGVSGAIRSSSPHLIVHVLHMTSHLCVCLTTPRDKCYFEGICSAILLTKFRQNPPKVRSLM